MDKPTSFFTTKLPRLTVGARLIVGLWLTAAVAGASFAQEEVAPTMGGAFVPEVPATYDGGGSFFNRQLGTAFRFNYHSEGYGTTDGVVSLGSMKVWADQGSTFFLDAQGTMSDQFGGGFNAGGGYRVLNNIGFGFDPLRIHGINFWTDGQSTEADNFFSQLGVGLESLGDSVDLRFQGYFPLERSKDSDTITISDIDPFYSTNFLIGEVNQFTRDTALTVVDLEGAKRILNFEAWAFLGGYHLTGSEIDATGYRAGVRGYAVPDLALSVQVTDDDLYHTNVMFGITWFVGRTHRLNAPGGTILDRFREPVLRNDFIATTQSTITTPGDPLTDAVTGDPFFFVHVDSNAAAGGDGTFENPFNTLEEAETGSAPNNIVLAHAGSTFAPTQMITLQDDQRWLGEGIPDNGDPNAVAVVHTVNTAERGILDLPETAPGAFLLAAPVINAGGIPTADPNNAAFQLADDDEINNFTINGGTRSVIGTGVDSPQLANLIINDPNSDAIVFTDVTGSSLIENTVMINNPGGRGIVVDGGSGVLGANAQITNSTGYLIEIFERSGGSVTVGELLQESMGQGVFVHNNTGGNITFSALADITTDGADSAVELENNTGATIAFQQLRASSGDADTFIVSGGGTISVANPTVTDPNTESALLENTGTGSTVVVRGDIGAFDGNPAVTILADVNNGGTGRVVDIQEMSGGSVNITGDVNDPNGTGEGILVQANTAGTFSFAGATTLETGPNTAVTLRENTGATINFGRLTARSDSDGATPTFLVEGGGTINNTDPNSVIENTGTGSALVVAGDTVFDGNPTVTLEADITNTGGGRAVDIQGMTGGGVTINGDVTDTDGMGLGILVEDNSAGTYAFNGFTNLSTGNNIAVELEDNTGATITFADLSATADGATTFSVVGGGTVTVADDPNGDGTGISNTGAGSALVVRGNAGGGAGNPTVSIDDDIVNEGAGEVVDIQGMTDGDVTITGDVTDTGGTGEGILIQDNTAGTFAFSGNTNLSTGNNTAVRLQNNTGATVDFTNLDATTDDATTFSVVGGGTINVNDPNNTGTGITNTGTGAALLVRGNADATGVGNPTVTIAKDIANGGGGRVVDIQSMTAGAVTITGDVSDPNGDGTGIIVANNTAGIYAFSGNTNVATEGANNAVTLENNSGATVNFTNLEASAVDGTTFSVVGGGTVNVNDPNNTGTGITNTGTGSALVVRGNADAVGVGNPTVTIAKDIANGGGGQVVDVQSMTGGAVNITGDVSDPNGDGAGVIVASNTNGTVSFTGVVTLATGTNDALTVTGNAAAQSTTFSNTSRLDIDTTSGRGIVNTGAGALNVLGTGNTIDTTLAGGIAMEFTNAGNANINNVAINAAAADAVDIEHNAATNSIVALTNVDIQSAGNIGVDFLANGTGQVDLRMNNVDMDSIGDEGILVNTGASANRVDLTLENSVITVGDNSAFLADLDESNTADVRFLIDQNELNNNSVGSATLDITVSSGLLLSATIGNGPSGLDPNAPTPPIGDRNRFVNTGAAGADAVVISADMNNARINLDLRDNTAQAADLQFQLNQNNVSTFNLVDRDDTLADDNNIGDVTTNGGTFGNIAAPVLQPTN